MELSWNKSINFISIEKSFFKPTKIRILFLDHWIWRNLIIHHISVAGDFVNYFVFCTWSKSQVKKTLFISFYRALHDPPPENVIPVTKFESLFFTSSFVLGIKFEVFRYLQIKILKFFGNHHQKDPFFQEN